MSKCFLCGVVIRGKGMKAIDYFYPEKGPVMFCYHCWEMVGKTTRDPDDGSYRFSDLVN